jgi:short subunit dehydrogenase-like uncharacterized protein
VPDFDVVILGASGAAGARTAQYLSARAPETGARWAVAGRSRAGIERRLAELGIGAPEVIVADVDDPRSLASMTARTSVVLNAVGPYTPSARRVIEACVAAGAHYADLTGEIAHVRRMVQAMHERARAAGVKVVQVCGFEALPPDLAVLLAVEQARARWDERLVAVELEASVAAPPGRPRVSDWLSNGTRQSMLAVCRGDDPRIIAEAGALVTDDRARGEINAVSPIRLAPRRRPGGGVIGPLPPAFINPAVIHRTAALLAAEAREAGEAGEARGAFRYREGVVLRHLIAAGALALPLAAIRSASRARPAMRSAGAHVLESLFRVLGPGPSDDRLNGWTWAMSVSARTPTGHLVRVGVTGEGHPGSGTTARMFGESGLLLSEPGATPSRAGCLTPATALGCASAARFSRAGLRFSYDAQ